MFIAVGVVFRAVEDGDADFAGRVDLGGRWVSAEGGFWRVRLAGSPLGWKRGVLKVILGGRRGYSGGKMRWAR